MDKDYFWDLIKGALLWMLFFGLACFLFVVSSCGVNRISYKQTEMRIFSKSDSLNLKIEPSEVIEQGRRWKYE